MSDMPKASTVPWDLVVTAFNFSWDVYYDDPLREEVASFVLVEIASDEYFHMRVFDSVWGVRKPGHVLVGWSGHALG